MTGEEALEAGASDYVTKPVDLEKLFAVIHMWRSRTSTTAGENLPS